MTKRDVGARTVYFVGPTLRCAEVTAIDPDAVVCPPAAHGDVYRVATGCARTIVIIDGLFEAVRAIWHKEILWALDQGCRLIGAASMGAASSRGVRGIRDGAGWAHRRGLRVRSPNE